jgi:hypothetical protein
MTREEYNEMHEKCIAGANETLKVMLDSCREWLGKANDDLETLRWNEELRKVNEPRQISDIQAIARAEAMNSMMLALVEFGLDANVVTYQDPDGPKDQIKLARRDGSYTAMFDVSGPSDKRKVTFVWYEKKLEVVSECTQRAQLACEAVTKTFKNDFSYDEDASVNILKK